MLKTDYLGKCNEKSRKDLRHNLNKQNPNNPHKVVLRSVSAFSLQELQKKNKVHRQISNVHVTVKPKQTLFRRLYEGERIPFYIAYNHTGKRYLAMKQGFYIDCQFYMPVFFEALSEQEYPYSYLAKQGLQLLIQNSYDTILPALPRIIMAIKRVMLTKQLNAIIHCLEFLQVMVKNCQGVGLALTAYYKHILPSLNILLNKDRDIMYPKSREEVMGIVIEDTLHIFECYGGPDAFINIKYNIPTYQSLF